MLRIKQYLNLHSRKLFFNAYILPHLDYCSSIWGSCTDELANSIVKFQKRAARIILDKDMNTPSFELFRELKWMTFPERTVYKQAILVYKSLNNTAPEYLNAKFQYKTNTSTVNLRSIDNAELVIPKPRIEFFRKGISYKGPLIWNAIPKHIRLADSLSSFKSSYLRWKYSGSSGNSDT